MEKELLNTTADKAAFIAWEKYCELYEDETGVKPTWTKWSDKTAEEWEAEDVHTFLEFLE